MNSVAFTATKYPSDLTDSQWEQIAERFPQGPSSEHAKRSFINGVLYLVNNGCKCQAFPHAFPTYSTVHSCYRRAGLNGLWKIVLKVMVEKHA